jgi:hypothetical protein
MNSDRLVDGWTADQIEAELSAIRKVLLPRVRRELAELEHEERDLVKRLESFR